VSPRARIVVASVVFVGFLFGAVFPTRTYLAQRRDIAAASRRVDVFTEQNGRLEAEASRLRSDEEIERIARERYNLVRPGEEAYAVVPTPPPTPVAATSAGPGADRRGLFSAFLRRTLDTLF
jgi:cell division protein FtsB